MPPNLENTAVATGWKGSVFIPIPQKGRLSDWTELNPCGKHFNQWSELLLTCCHLRSHRRDHTLMKAVSASAPICAQDATLGLENLLDFWRMHTGTFCTCLSPLGRTETSMGEGLSLPTSGSSVATSSAQFYAEVFRFNMTVLAPFLGQEFSYCPNPMLSPFHYSLISSLLR